MTIFSGSLAAISALPMLLADPHSYFLLPDPGYFAYQKAIQQAEAIPYYMPLDGTNDYFPDYDEIPDNVIAKTSSLFLNYPHNPTGKVATKAFFEETVAFANHTGIPVIHDFAYGI